MKGIGCLEVSCRNERGIGCFRQVLVNQVVPS